MKKEKVFTWLTLLLAWQLLAMSIQNEILIPYPIEVFSLSITNFSKLSFYTITATTLFRVLKGFFISFLSALLLSILSNQSSKFRMMFEPIQVLTKSIPNISYIIITLIWFGSEASVSIICFLVLFPIFYNNFLFAMDNESQELKDIEKIYPESFLEATKSKTLPMLIPTMLETSKITLGLGLKVSVMAEILGQVRVGIGKQLYLSRINLDTANLFFWTIVIIFICFIIDLVFDQFINKHQS